MATTALRAYAHDFLTKIVVTLFGVLIPVALAAQAYLTMSGLEKSLTTTATVRLTDLIPAQLVGKEPAFDYALAALVFMEASNRQVVTNKQMMKIGVMQVGFAVISIGLMLIFLGVDAGGMTFSAKSEAGFSAAGKVTSTGVLAFVFGASMVALGGLLANEYRTLGVPGFGGSSATPINSSGAQFVSSLRIALAKLRTRIAVPLKQSSKSALQTRRRNFSKLREVSDEEWSTRLSTSDRPPFGRSSVCDLRTHVRSSGGAGRVFLSVEACLRNVRGVLSYEVRGAKRRRGRDSNRSPSIAGPITTPASGGGSQFPKPPDPLGNSRAQARGETLGPRSGRLPATPSIAR